MDKYSLICIHYLNIENILLYKQPANFFLLLKLTHVVFILKTENSKTNLEQVISAFLSIDLASPREMRIITRIEAGYLSIAAIFSSLSLNAL